MTLAAGRSKAVIMFSVIYSLLFLTFGVGVSIGSLFRCAFLGVFSSLAIDLLRNKRASCFTLIKST